MGPKSPPKMPKPEPAPPPPEKSQDSIQNNAAQQRMAAYGTKGGLAQSMLTGGAGAAAPSTSSAVRFLGNVGR